MRLTVLFLAYSFIMTGFLVPTYASPLDILNQYRPDIAVTDVRQETRYVYVKVCNLGGVLPDSAHTLVIALKKPNDGVVSRTVSVGFLNNTGCYEFQIASLDELGITSSATYLLSAGAFIDGLPENNKVNNRMNRYVGIMYPSYIPYTPQTSQTYYSNDTSLRCTFSNNYCGNCDQYGNCPGYRSNDTSNAFYRYDCPAGSYCSNNYAPVNDYYPTNQSKVRCTPENNYCRFDGQYNQNYYYNHTSPNYNSSYNPNYYPNYYPNTYVPPIIRSDLTVENISANYSDRRIVARICNRSSNMPQSALIRTDFLINNATISNYTTLLLMRDQCNESAISVSIPSGSLPYDASYRVSVTVDTGNALDESNESNNTRVQYLQLSRY